MSTIREVAARVGVTVGTVSRALNGYADVSAKTRARIIQVAKELNYVPNATARSLSSKKPPNIGLIVSGLLDAENLQNTFISHTMQGVFRYASQERLEVAMYMADSAEQRDRSLTQFCRGHNLAGVVVSGMRVDDPYLSELVEAGVPTVAIDIPIEGEAAGWVSIDNTQATYELVRSLTDQGHRSIAVIDGRVDAAVCTMRLAGTRRALEEVGEAIHEETHRFAAFKEEDAYRETRALLATDAGRACTAIVCFSDTMALGAMRAIREAGHRIPEDISVVGFDGLPVSAWTAPTLTTVRQDMAQMAYEAASMLHAIMRGESSPGYRALPHQLLLRGSIHPPRAGALGGNS